MELQINDHGLPEVRKVFMIDKWVDFPKLPPLAIQLGEWTASNGEILPLFLRFYQPEDVQAVIYAGLEAKPEYKYRVAVYASLAIDPEDKTKPTANNGPHQQ